MSVHLVDILGGALYVTPATQYSNESTVNSGTNEPTKGDVMGSNWYMSYSTTGTSGVYEIKAAFSQEIDLTGLQHQVIAPMGLQTFQTESTGAYSKDKGYVRDFTWITTCPLDINDLLDKADDFSPVAPYQTFDSGGGTDLPAVIAKEQLFSGRAMLWSNDTAIPSLLGFMRNLWNQDWTLGNMAATRKLYYYRVVYAYGDFSGTAHSVPFMLDLPARHDQLAYVEVDADENTEAMTMIRSYQAPGGGST